MFADSESLTTPHSESTGCASYALKFGKYVILKKSQRSFLKSMHKMIYTTACVYVTYNATTEPNVQLFPPLNTTEMYGDEMVLQQTDVQ